MIHVQCEVYNSTTQGYVQQLRMTFEGCAAAVAAVAADCMWLGRGGQQRAYKL